MTKKKIVRGLFAGPAKDLPKCKQHIIKNFFTSSMRTDDQRLVVLKFCLDEEKEVRVALNYDYAYRVLDALKMEVEAMQRSLLLHLDSRG
jgi:hypothetical protein